MHYSNGYTSLKLKHRVSFILFLFNIRMLVVLTSLFEFIWAYAIIYLCPGWSKGRDGIEIS